MTYNVFGGTLSLTQSTIVTVYDSRSKSRGVKTPASSGRDRKGEKESEKEKGRTPVDSRRAATGER